jgi:hypothetical protein
MYLLIINLYELGQFLRIMLWIALPAGIVSMLVTTFLQYRRSWREQSGLRLSIEGGAVDGRPLEAGRFEAGPVSHPGYGKGAGFDGQGPGGYGQGARGYDQGARGYNQGPGGQGDPGFPANEMNEAGSGEMNEADSRESNEAGSRPEDEEIDWNDGNENMYRGILWMKEKYEQYRELTDQRYERLREELGRSEQRYQDLLLTMEESKGRPPAMAQPQEEGQARGAGQVQAVERAYGVEEPHPYDLLAGELNAKQAVIEELEEQLRLERLRVEELIVRLQTNGQLLQQIYIELDKSYGMARPSEPQE